MAKKETDIKVVIVEPNKPARVEVIGNDIKVLQGLVGGYVEAIKLDDFDILVNEDGKALELEPNFHIYNGQDFISGTAVFTGVDYKKGEWKSLSDEVVAFITEVFEARGQQ